MENPQNEWDKSVNHVSDKWLVPRILTITTHRQPSSKQYKQHRHVFKDTQTANNNKKILDIFSHQGNKCKPKIHWAITSKPLESKNQTTKYS